MEPDVSSAVAPADRDARPPGWGPRTLVAAGLAVVAAVGVAVAVRAAASGRYSRSRVPAASTTSTQSIASRNSAEEQARRNHPPKAPPFPDMSGIIAAKDVLHHSGGPYLTRQQAADIVLESYNCKLGGHAGNDPDSRCTQVDVRFFDYYADFWAVEGGQTQFVGAWGPDREMYVVTIFGKLPFMTTSAAQTSPAYTASRTFQIDATTGRVLMTGGAPLPERFAGVTTLRAP